MIVWRLPRRVRGHIRRKRDGREPENVAERLTFGLLTISHHLDVHIMKTKVDKRTAINEGMS